MNYNELASADSINKTIETLKTRSIEAVLVSDRAAAQSILRRQALFADYYLGSAHAITEEGEIISVSKVKALSGFYSGERLVVCSLSSQLLIEQTAKNLRYLINLAFTKYCRAEGVGFKTEVRHVGA